MSVRTAVARRDEVAVEQARQRPKTLPELAKEAVDNQSAMLDAILPSHVDRRRFSAMTLQALKDTPKLLECFATKEGCASFVLSVGQAAVVGLEPNTPTEECWILPRRNRYKDDSGQWVWRQEAELSLGYRGLLKLARRTGNVRAVLAQVVREGDEFEYGHGLDGDYLVHKPLKGGSEDRRLLYAYCVVRFHAGDPIFEVLDEAEVNARRASSESWKRDQRNDTSHSPWSQTHRIPRMWRKSAIRAIWPYLDFSIEVGQVVERDEKPLAYDPDRGVIEAPSEDAVEQPALEMGDFDLPEPEPATGTGPIEATASEGPAPRMATKDQLTAVNTLLGKKCGATGDDRLTALAQDDLLGRGVSSTKEITFDEASALIEHLGSLPDYIPPAVDGPGTEPFEGAKP